MNQIEEIEVEQLRENLGWALDFVQQTFGRTPEQIAARPQGVVSFAAARLLYNDDIDFPAGDRKLFDRLAGELPHVFEQWRKQHGQAH